MNAGVLCSIFEVFRIIPETFRHAIWAAILGIVMAGAVPVVILRIVQRRRQSLEPDGRIFLTCGVLFILLVLQFIPMFAAFSFKHQIGKFEAKIHEEMTATSVSDGMEGRLQMHSKELIDNLKEEYPFLTKIVDMESVKEIDSPEMVHEASERICSYLNGMIVKTLLISIAMISITAIWLMRITPHGRHSSRRRTPLQPRRMTRPGNRRRY